MSLLLTLAFTWLIGGTGNVLAVLYAAGGWAGLVEELEEEEVGYPVLDASAAAGLLLVVAFIAWPYFVLEAAIRSIRSD